MKLIAKNRIKTKYGSFHFFVFEINGFEHIAVVKGNLANSQNLFCRIHSACILGEVFYSSLCDCRKELDEALSFLSKKNNGIIIYLNQSSLKNLVKDFDKMYKKQTKRYFDDAANILKYFRIKSIKIFTNNQEKINQINSSGIKASKY